MRLGGFEPPTRGLEVDAGEVAAPREDWAGRMVGWQRLGRARTICGPVVDPTLTLPADARLGCMLELLTCLQGQKRSERRPALRDRRRNAHERKSLFAATPWAQRLGGAEEIAGRIVDERVDGGRAARRRERDLHPPRVGLRGESRRVEGQPPAGPPGSRAS